MKKTFFFLKLTIAEIIILSLEFLLSYLTMKDTNLFDVFLSSIYLEIPSIILYLLSILSGILLDEKRYESFKRNQKRIYTILILSSLFACVILDLIYIFLMNLSSRFSLQYVACIVYLFLLDYPWLKKEKKKDTTDELIKKSHEVSPIQEETEHESHIDNN